MVLLNASANPLQRNCMQLKPHSEFSICRRTKKMIGLQIENHCNG